MKVGEVVYVYISHIVCDFVLFTDCFIELTPKGMLHAVEHGYQHICLVALSVDIRVCMAYTDQCLY